MSTDTETGIINGITLLISFHLSQCEMESTNPQHQADKMDATIKYHRDIAAKLRTIRNDLEDTFALVMPSDY